MQECDFIEVLYKEYENDIRSVMDCINEESIEYIDDSVFADSEQRYYLTLDGLQKRIFSLFYNSFPRFDICLSASTLYSTLFRYNLTQTTYGNLYRLNTSKKHYNTLLSRPFTDISTEMVSALEKYDDTLLLIDRKDQQILIDYHFKELLRDDETVKFLHCSALFMSNSYDIYNFSICVSDQKELDFIKTLLSPSFGLSTLHQIMKVSLIAVFQMDKIHNAIRSD